jgi:acyl carrier protein
MVPSQFILLEKLPITPSGKIDRRSLPSSEFINPVEEPVIAPRTSVEARLVEMWKEVFHVQKISVNENFFELGGHSLLATKLISRIRTKFHVELPLRIIFESPTIAGLAAAIALQQAGEPAPEHLMGIIANLDSLTEEEAKRLLN